MSAGSWYQHLDTGLSTLDSFLTKSWTAKSFFLGIRLRASRLRRDIGGIVLACPKLQPRSGVLAGDAMAALPRKWVSGSLRLVA
jgi:hypothetical protein